MKPRCQFSAVFSFLILIAVCTGCNHKKAETGGPQPNAKPKLAATRADENDAAPLVNLTTANYELTIYGAFAFFPDDSLAGLMKPEQGNQFVVLDLSVLNTSADRAVDMGQILASATVADNNGTIYPQSPLAVQAFQLQYPEPGHRQQYKAIKARIRPGRYYRTTAFGFEAPLGVKNFLLSVDVDGKRPGGKGANTVSFSID